MEGSWTRRLAVLVALATITASCARWANLPLGTTKRQLVVAGVTRTYLMRAGGEGMPGRALVLVLHGLGGTGAAIERRTCGTFDRLADRDGAVIVYPDVLPAPRSRSARSKAADTPGPAATSPCRAPSGPDTRPMISTRAC